MRFLSLSIFIFLSFSWFPHEEIFVSRAKIFEGNCDSIPKINKEIIAYTKTTIGKKINTGQCWDLASEALKKVNAKWDGLYNFGKKVDPETDCVFPGDIMQFEGVQIEYQEGNMRYMESMGHHTAIIFKVKGKGNYELAHQNYGRAGLKVGISNLELKNITKGEYFIYRPIKSEK